MIKNFVLFVILVFFSFACTKEVSKDIEIKEKNIELQVMEAYNEGLKELESGDVLYAAKKFNEVEIMFPQSKWAAKSTLMAAYAYYSQDYYYGYYRTTIRKAQKNPQNWNFPKIGKN